MALYGGFRSEGGEVDAHDRLYSVDCGNALGSGVERCSGWEGDVCDVGCHFGPNRDLSLLVDPSRDLLQA